MREEDVRNLVGRYCHEVTTLDVDRWAATWAADATWTIPGEGTLVGRDAIRDTFARIRRTYLLCVQEILSGVIDVVDDDHATARWYIRELQWRDVEGETFGSELIGTYDDTIVRTSDGELLFGARRFSLLYAGPVAMEGRLRRPQSSS